MYMYVYIYIYIYIDICTNTHDFFKNNWWGFLIVEKTLAFPKFDKHYFGFIVGISF